MGKLLGNDPVIVRGIALRLTTPAALFAFALAGCASSSPLADQSADLDGKTQVAKPGMARLYLLDGYIISAKTANPNQQTTISPPVAPAGGLVGAIVTGVISGAGQAMINNKRQADREEALKDTLHPGSERYALVVAFNINGVEVGKVGWEKYMALDLPPGEYELRSISTALRDTHANIPMKVNLASGDVAYYRALEDFMRKERSVEACPVDCARWVKLGQRVVADPVSLVSLKSRAAEPAKTE